MTQDNPRGTKYDPIVTRNDPKKIKCDPVATQIDPNLYYRRCYNIEIDLWSCFSNIRILNKHTLASF